MQKFTISHVTPSKTKVLKVIDSDLDAGDLLIKYIYHHQRKFSQFILETLMDDYAFASDNFSFLNCKISSEKGN